MSLKFFDLKSFISIFCQIVLVFGMTFGVLTSVPVHAAESGVIGFSDCNFGSAEKIRTSGQGGTAPGNETFRKCLQQILTFVFVLGVFLIGIRIAIEAFKSLNPIISGNSINNSVKLGQDIVIGLILIGAPSIFLGLFNEAALQLPNLFELAQFRPGNEAAKTATGSGTGTSGTGTTGTTGTTGGTTGGTSGTGGGAATGTGLKVDGKDVSPKDLADAIKARDEGKKLTPEQEKILKEYDKKPATTSGDTVWISQDQPKVNTDEVVKALAEAQKNSTDGSNKLAQDGIRYAQSLGKSCLSSSLNPNAADSTACDLIKGLQLTNPIYRMEYLSGQKFVLADGWSRPNFAPGGSATTGKKDHDITLIKGNQQILVKLRCDNVASAQNSLLTKDTFRYTTGDNLNSAGCDATANFTKI